MLRAMWLTLKVHSAAHPEEPFDHEKHMPSCMREAREDPATWAGGSGGGAGGSGSLSPEAKATVVAELKSLIEPKENSVVTLRTKEPSLMHALSNSSLLLLGAENIKQAKDPNAKAKHILWLPVFLANLRSCLVEGDDCAFPGFKVEENVTGNMAGIQGGRRFTGEYVKGLELVGA